MGNIRGTKAKFYSDRNFAFLRQEILKLNVLIYPRITFLHVIRLWLGILGKSNCHDTLRMIVSAKCLTIIHRLNFWCLVHQTSAYKLMRAVTLYGSKIKNGDSYAIRLDFCLSILPSRIFRFLRETGFFWRGDVEYGLILPSDYLQLNCMTCLYRTYAVGSIKMK